MAQNLSAFISQHRPALEAALERHLPLSSQPRAEHFNEAVRYAIFPGGKRWRPTLTLLGASIVGGEVGCALPVACAMEYLHTSSIILDDLPAMDDADLRRGRPALHQVFGESVALLAALALLNQAYALLAQAARERGTPGLAERLVADAAACIGADGMIGGQVVDLALHGEPAETDVLASRNLKTTALMRLMMSAGAVAAGATEREGAALAHFGECLGAAYQICDDLLDELAAGEATGKPVRQDRRHRRASFVAEFGVEESRRMAMTLVDEGQEALARVFGQRGEVHLFGEAAELIIGKVAEPGLVADLVA